MSNDTLAARRVAVIEDDYFLMEELCAGLEAAGAVVLGPVPSVEEALALIAAEADIDGAILDVNLGGRMADPVADALQARQIPFVFTTGYDAGGLNERYPSVPHCEKPAEFGAIAKALLSVMRASVGSERGTR